MPSYESLFSADLSTITQKGLFRRRLTLETPQGSTVRVDGRSLLNFSSNDYLGLANDSRLISALQDAAAEFGVGSGASQLICGRHAIHAELESELARATGRERALLFSSGYLANITMVNALCPGRGDLVVEDRLCHASLIDSARLSRAIFKRYRHADPSDLERQLTGTGSRRRVVVTDAVFSMDGDIAPLKEIAAVCQEYEACLMVDDAHGFGVLGGEGMGTLQHLALGQREVPLLMATFGKAFGCSGAFVAGSEEVIELLIQRGRGYIYSTAPPPALMSTALAALRLVREGRGMRTRLQELINRFRIGARGLSLPLMESQTPIQPVLIGEPVATVRLAEQLFDQGFLVSAIRPPTVPENTSRLRITLTAAHTNSDVDRLLAALAAGFVASNRGDDVGE